jgi:hypothetical protein
MAVPKVPNMTAIKWWTLDPKPCARKTLSALLQYTHGYPVDHPMYIVHNNGTHFVNVSLISKLTRTHFKNPDIVIINLRKTNWLFVSKIYGFSKYLLVYSFRRRRKASEIGIRLISTKINSIERCNQGDHMWKNRPMDYKNCLKCSPTRVLTNIACLGYLFYFQKKIP